VQAAQLELDAAQRETPRGETEPDALRQARQLVEEGPDKPFLDLFFSDALHGFVVGAYGLAFATQDGGNSWQSIRSRLDNPSGLHLYGIAKVGDDLFIGGEQGTLLRSSDQGVHFEALAPPGEGTLFGVQALGDHALIAFGLRGKAFMSNDRGESWQPLDTLQPATLTSSLGLGDGSALLVDESGRVLRYVPGDSRLALIPVEQPGYFTGVTRAANGDLVISTARGMIVAGAIAPALEQHP